MISFQKYTADSTARHHFLEPRYFVYVADDFRGKIASSADAACTLIRLIHALPPIGRAAAFILGIAC